MMPNLGLNIHVHISATATQAEMTGIKKAPRKKVRPINFWFINLAQFHAALKETLTDYAEQYFVEQA